MIIAQIAQIIAQIALIISQIPTVQNSSTFIRSMPYASSTFTGILPPGLGSLSRLLDSRLCTINGSYFEFVVQICFLFAWISWVLVFGFALAVHFIRP